MTANICRSLLSVTYLYQEKIPTMMIAGNTGDDDGHDDYDNYDEDKDRDR